MDHRFYGVVGAALAVTLTTGATQAAGNLASQPTRLETAIDSANQTWTGNEFQLEVGKYYIWEITSDGAARTEVEAPGLFRNAWFNQIVVNDKEIHTSGALHGVSYDGEGMISLSFVPMQPGDYTFSVPGSETLTGTLHVTGDSLMTEPTPLELGIDTARLAYSQTEFELETGKAYRLDVTSDGLEELGVTSPELLQNSWLDQLVIDGLGVQLNGAFSSIEYDDEGTISVFFVPVRPGNYPFFSPGYEEAGLAGTFVVR